MAIPVTTIKFVAKRKRWLDINSNNELNPEDYVTCNCGTQVKVVRMILVLIPLI